MQQEDAKTRSEQGGGRSPIVLLSGAGLVSLVLVVLAGSPWARGSWYRLVYSDEVAEIEDAVRRIERFRGKHGRLPSEAEIVTDPGKLFYRPLAAGYVIGCHTGLDNYVSYDSSQYEWWFEGRLIDVR